MPSSPTAVRSIGAYAWQVLGRCGDGVVHSAFSRAAYLAFDDDLVALVDATVPNGPLHIRVDSVPALRVGQDVRVGGGVVSIGSRSWRVPARAWAPARAGDIRAARATFVELVVHQPALDVGRGAAGSLEELVGPYLRQADLDRACGLVFGRGAGLTPAGDDAAAGIILVHALLGTVAPSHLDLLARTAPTHAISRAFLRCAALGYSLEPIHDALRAAEHGDRDAVRRCIDAAARIGSTSGLDMLAGVRAALVGVDEATEQRVSVLTTLEGV